MINLYFELSSVADWIVVLFSFIGICIAEAGLILAFDTVNDWKKQKEWEIWTESIIYAEKAYDFLLFIYGPGGRTTEFIIEDKLQLSLKENDKENIKWQQDAMFGFRRHENTIEEVKYHLKKVEHLNNKETTLKIVEYYKVVIELIEEWQKCKKDFDRFKNQFDILKNEKDISLQKLGELKEKKDASLLQLLLRPKTKLENAKNLLKGLKNLKFNL